MKLFFDYFKRVFVVIGKFLVYNQIKLKLKKLFLDFLSNEIFYINNPESLPPPLTKEEEVEVFKKIVSGNLNDRSILIVRNLRLVVYIAKKFEYSYCQKLEDLVSIGTIGLIKAVRTFCPEKNIKLATYASRCIENEILMHLRKISNLKNETSIDEPYNIDWDGNELLFSDVLGTDSNIISCKIEKKSENESLHKMIDNLNKREKTIMEMRFGLKNGKELTQKQVADLLGISQSYISRLEKKIIFKLKKKLERAC